ncbi:MAG: ABC transporter permease [Lachnospiraceae bacterium]|nr:ABC transporter permease [Lachnospiraceae bacterium]
MRLLKLELKRVLKTRMTVVLLLLSFGFSFLLAWLPTTFSRIKYTDEEGYEVELKGLESIRYEKEVQRDTAGDVTPEKVRRAFEQYQACLTKYKAETTYDLPEGVYVREILPYSPLLHGVREAYADPHTGIAPSLMEIDPEELDHFYEKCTERNLSLMKQEQKDHEAAQNAGAAMYEKVEKPFRFFPGYGSDPMDYEILLTMLILLFGTVMIAPVFTSDYQTGADDILRCTRYGKTKLAVTKTASALLICGATYFGCICIYLLVSNSLFGWECTETSMQMIYSAMNLPDMSIGELQRFVALGGLLSIIAASALTLFVSSAFKNVAASVSVSLLFCILPVVIYMALPAEIANWIYPVLPAAGGAGLQASILYAAIDFDFWNIGNFALWLPYVMLWACALEIPLFIVLTIRSYLGHNEM